MHGVDATYCPGGGVSAYDAVDGRVAHVHVGWPDRSCTQGLSPPGTHRHASRRNRSDSPPGCGHATERDDWACRHRLSGTRISSRGQIIHIGLALQNELLGVLVALVKVIAAIEDAVGVSAQPVQILNDMLTYSLTLAGGLVSSRRRLNLPPYWFAMDQLM